MSIIQALINNGSADDIHEAKEILYEMIEMVHAGVDPEEVLFEYGLEPDYLFEII